MRDVGSRQSAFHDDVIGVLAPGQRAYPMERVTVCPGRTKIWFDKSLEKGKRWSAGILSRRRRQAPPSAHLLPGRCARTAKWDVQVRIIFQTLNLVQILFLVLRKGWHLDPEARPGRCPGFGGAASLSFGAFVFGHE